jgi:hypothetical protein
MKTPGQDLEEKVHQSVPVVALLAQLIEALERQMATEAKQREAERRERARFHYD